MIDGRIGLIDTPLQQSATSTLEVLNTSGTFWCADNGAFSERFDEPHWWRFLNQRAEHAGSCTFAVAPDVVGDPHATLGRSLPWLPKMRDLGYPAALVGQDGLERMEVPWKEFDCFFIGGSTLWKLSSGARRLAAEAKERGKWVHMGRVNSFKRIIYAHQIGCDSVDGTHITYAPSRRLPEVLMWVEILNGVHQ